MPVEELVSVKIAECKSARLGIHQPDLASYTVAVCCLISPEFLATFENWIFCAPLFAFTDGKHAATATSDFYKEQLEV